MLKSASWAGILTSAGAASITHGTWQQSTQALNVVFCSSLQRYSEDAQLFTLYCTENKESTSQTCLDRPAYYQGPEILLACLNEQSPTSLWRFYTTCLKPRSAILLKIVPICHRGSHMSRLAPICLNIYSFSYCGMECSSLKPFSFLRSNFASNLMIE